MRTSSDTIAISRIHFPVTTLGYGRRVGLWVQGCSIRCPGCISRDTWVARKSHHVRHEDVIWQLRSWLPEAEGLTLSGGEPLDQPEALHRLVDDIRDSVRGDILMYSGYAWETVREKAPWVCDLVDAVISDPYEPSAGADRVWRGSDNQRFLLLSPLARERYGEDVSTRPWPSGRSLDVCVTGTDVWVAGIPRPGDLSRLRKALLRKEFDADISSEPRRLAFRS